MRGWSLARWVRGTLGAWVRAARGLYSPGPRRREIKAKKNLRSMKKSSDLQIYGSTELALFLTQPPSRFVGCSDKKVSLQWGPPSEPTWQSDDDYDFLTLPSAPARREQLGCSTQSSRL